MVLANIYRHDSDAIYRYIFGHNCSNPIQSNWIKMKWNEGKLESSQRLESLDDSVEKLDTAGDGIHISAVLNVMVELFSNGISKYIIPSLFCMSRKKYLA